MSRGLSLENLKEAKSSKLDGKSYFPEKKKKEAVLVQNQGKWILWPWLLVAVCVTLGKSLDLSGNSVWASSKWKIWSQVLSSRGQNGSSPFQLQHVLVLCFSLSCPRARHRVTEGPVGPVFQMEVISCPVWEERVLWDGYPDCQLPFREARLGLCEGPCSV